MKKMGKRIVIVVTVLVVILAIMIRCNKNNEFEKLTWPNSGIGEMLPVPDVKYGDIVTNSEDRFSARLDGVKTSDFDKYINRCKDEGFSIISQMDENSFDAYNEEGYKLSVSIIVDTIYIELDTPKVNKDLKWPTMGLATLIPQPKGTKGTISVESSSQFSVYVGETSEDEYSAYVEKCINNGFNVDYSKGEKTFSADNASGDSIRVTYEGFDTMYICVYASDENNTTTINEDIGEGITTELKEETTKNEENVSGIRPEFKEAMDSYEEFFDEYIAFMEKYSKSNDPTAMLNDYTNYLNKYTETMEKLNNIQSDEISTEELLYYNEVMGRINQKLLSVGY